MGLDLGILAGAVREEPGTYQEPEALL